MVAGRGRGWRHTTTERKKEGEAQETWRRGNLATRAAAAGWMGREDEGERSWDSRDEPREVTVIGEAGAVV